MIMFLATELGHVQFQKNSVYLIDTFSGLFPQQQCAMGFAVRLLCFYGCVRDVTNTYQ